MFRKYLFLCLSLLIVLKAGAQLPDDEYYPYASTWSYDETTPVLLPDSTLFYRAIQHNLDLYGRITSFSLPYVSQNRRGLPYHSELFTYSGIPVSSRHAASLRLLGAAEERSGGIAMLPNAVGCIGGIRSFEFWDKGIDPFFRASVNFTDRNYRVGSKVAFARQFGAGWSLSAGIDARTGRDMRVEGVFTNALTASFHVAKRFAENHSLELLVIIPPSMRGTRLSSVEEAFRLTEDPLYNPAWGFQRGKMRNSRVRRDFLPLLGLVYRLHISVSTRLDLALGAECGIQKYSALGWYNARTPMPDNYHYLPGYTGDRETEIAWRENRSEYTQINWDELIAQNRMRGGEAAYALEDRVERITRLTANMLFVTDLDSRLTLRYGAAYRMFQTRNYKQMRDLLGAEYITDIDQYLVDDDTYGNKLQNNLRHPDRSILEGDRFGYDYKLSTREVSALFRAEYRADRFRADLALTLSDVELRRRGYYEKELFPGAQSFGRSRSKRFTPYTIKALAGWAFSPRSYIELSAAVGTLAPNVEHIFYQPQYNNRTIDDPSPERFYSAELNYSRTGEKLTLRLTAFASTRLDGSETHRYYDDMASTFSDMAIAGIGRMSYGLEAAADIRLAYRWNLSFAASGGRYKYIRNPRITVLSDIDNTVIDQVAVSRMGDCELGASPQIAACAELGFFGRKGWGFHLSAGYLGGRYVEPMPLRRTERIARQGGITPETFASFTRQERLDDAFTLGVSLFKSFYFNRSRLTLSLMLHNLLGQDDAVFSGYESLRVQRLRSGDQLFYSPHATRYIHAYPQSFYFTVTYKF